MNQRSKILLVDDDLDLLKIYKQIFKLNDYDIITTPDSTRALQIIESDHISVVITDIIMPKMDGIQLLKHIKSLKSQTQVIMLTAEGSISGAVDSVRLGAFTYIVKPADIDDLLFNVHRAQELFITYEENIALKKQVASLSKVAPFIGNSYTVEKIRETIEIVAKSDSAVLITGESGTGKEIIASHIHSKSNRSSKPFIKVNCAALAGSVLESELFGHEKGAFTGADKTHIGRFEMANQGTLLLDEISELTLPTQAKLLRVLQEKEFERVGGNIPIKTDFRLIASTNRDLMVEIKNGRFREDLFYRLNVVPIHFPPLRERREDIAVLSKYFLALWSHELNKSIEPLSPDIIGALSSYNWPGNVRELKNIIERLVVLARDSKIRLSDLPEELKTISKPVLKTTCSLQEARSQFEKNYISAVLEKNNWNVASSARELQLARKNLYKKMKEYGIVSQSS